jgi:hypothetical protein
MPFKNIKGLSNFLCGKDSTLCANTIKFLRIVVTLFGMSMTSIESFLIEKIDVSSRPTFTYITFSLVLGSFVIQLILLKWDKSPDAEIENALKEFLDTYKRIGVLETRLNTDKMASVLNRKSVKRVLSVANTSIPVQRVSSTETDATDGRFINLSMEPAIIMKRGSAFFACDVVNGIIEAVFSKAYYDDSDTLTYTTDTVLPYWEGKGPVFGEKIEKWNPNIIKVNEWKQGAEDKVWRMIKYDALPLTDELRRWIKRRVADKKVIPAMFRNEEWPYSDCPIVPANRFLVTKSTVNKALKECSQCSSTFHVYDDCPKRNDTNVLGCTSCRLFNVDYVPDVPVGPCGNATCLDCESVKPIHGTECHCH